jgi:succinate dehydrogenase / fumarate reductase cytochrome b subunit
MSSTNNRTILLKKMMAVAGLIWFVYLIFHLFSVLTFHAGEAAFNAFYIWFNSSWIYPVLLALLGSTIIFHIYIAVTRQLANNKSAGDIPYKKSYPKAVPRIVAWSGAALVFAFIVIHSVQMLTIDLDTTNLYQQMEEIFSDPLMWVIYGLGMLAISAHLQHGLSNVLQTLGICSCQFYKVAWLIVVIIMVGFASIPLSIL